jgi:hypothetical protein
MSKEIPDSELALKLALTLNLLLSTL